MKSTIKTKSEKLYSELTSIAGKTNMFGVFKNRADYIIFLDCFEKLYYESDKDVFYWQYCPLKAYINSIEKRYSEYLLNFPDASENDFFRDELDLLHENYNNESLMHKDYSVTYLEGYKFIFPVSHGCYGFAIIQYPGNTLYTNENGDLFSKDAKRSFFSESEHVIYRNIELTQKRKIEFLESKLKPIEKNVILKPEFKEYLNHEDPEWLLSELKKIFPEGFKATDTARMIYALQNNNLINKPEIEKDLIYSIHKEWKCYFSFSGYGKARDQIIKSPDKGEACAAVNKVKKLIIS